MVNYKTRLVLLAILGILIDAYADCIEQFKVEGLSLGDSAHKVKVSLGDPEIVWKPSSSIASQGAEIYEMGFIYEGIEFYFINGSVDYIKITSDAYSLGKGYAVGQTLNEPYVTNIGDTDCYLEVIVESEIVTMIKLYCAI